MEEIELLQQKALSIVNQDGFYPKFNEWITNKIKADNDVIHLNRVIREMEKYNKMNNREKEIEVRNSLKRLDKNKGTKFYDEYMRIQAIWDKTTKELRQKPAD
jgi:hypothetical protein